MVLGLQVCQGVIDAFDTPARQAFLVSMIDDRADLPNEVEHGLRPASAGSDRPRGGR